MNNRLRGYCHMHAHRVRFVVRQRVEAGFVSQRFLRRALEAARVFVAALLPGSIGTRSVGKQLHVSLRPPSPTTVHCPMFPEPGHEPFYVSTPPAQKGDHCVLCQHRYHTPLVAGLSL